VRGGEYIGTAKSAAPLFFLFQESAFFRKVLLGFLKGPMIVMGRRCSIRQAQ
jgi:hypothetical protein